MSIHEPPIINSEFTAFDQRSYLFSVAQYHQLAEARIFQADDRVELLNGRIVRMSPIGPLHRRAVQCLTKLLKRRLPADWEVMVQQPIGLPGSGGHS
jgi:Uma2 family endonuclease